VPIWDITSLSIPEGRWSTIVWRNISISRAIVPKIVWRTVAGQEAVGFFNSDNCRGDHSVFVCKTVPPDAHRNGGSDEKWDLLPAYTTAYSTGNQTHYYVLQHPKPLKSDLIVWATRPHILELIQAQKFPLQGHNRRFVAALSQNASISSLPIASNWVIKIYQTRCVE